MCFFFFYNDTATTEIYTLSLHDALPISIAEIRPRRSVLARRAAQGSSGAGPRRSQPVAANVDQVIVVTSARDPEPSPRMIDRFLVIAEANGLPAAVVLNKIELDRAIEEPLTRRFKTASYQLLATSG